MPSFESAYGLSTRWAWYASSLVLFGVYTLTVFCALFFEPGSQVYYLFADILLPVKFAVGVACSLNVILLLAEVAEQPRQTHRVLFSGLSVAAFAYATYVALTQSPLSGSSYWTLYANLETDVKFSVAVAFFYAVAFIAASRPMEGLRISDRKLRELSTVLVNHKERAESISRASVGGRVLVEQEEKRQALCEQLRATTSSVRIVLYSLTSWKDAIERDLLEAVRRGVSVSILLLSGESPGILEKTMYESFGEKNPHEWKKDTRALLKSHRSHLQSSTDALRTWQANLQKSDGDRLQMRSYRETPNFYGFLLDDQVLYFSSFYLDPVERGFRLSAVLVVKGNDMLGDMIIESFRNWHAAKFALGEDVLARRL